MPQIVMADLNFLANTTKCATKKNIFLGNNCQNDFC
jgi:hypothetical protein